MKKTRLPSALLAAAMAAALLLAAAPQAALADPEGWQADVARQIGDDEWNPGGADEPAPGDGVVRDEPHELAGAAVCLTPAGLEAMRAPGTQTAPMVLYCSVPGKALGADFDLVRASYGGGPEVDVCSASMQPGFLWEDASGTCFKWGLTIARDEAVPGEWAVRADRNGMAIDLYFYLGGELVATAAAAGSTPRMTIGFTASVSGAPAVGAVLGADVTADFGDVPGSAGDPDVAYRWHYADDPSATIGTSGTLTVPASAAGRAIAVDVTLGGATVTAQASGPAFAAAVLNVTQAVGHATLEAALAAAAPGDELRLLADIDEGFDITYNAVLTIDMDGHDIDLNGGEILFQSNSDVTIVNGGTISTKQITTMGALDITADFSLQVGIFGYESSHTTIVGDIVSAGLGVYGRGTSTMSVTGDIHGVNAGALVDDESIITVNGDIKTNLLGASANGGGGSANARASITVNGDITVVFDPDRFDLSHWKYSYSGVDATFYATVIVNGDINVTGDMGCGVIVESEGYAEVNGDITVTGEVAVGVYASAYIPGGSYATLYDPVANVSGDVTVVGGYSVGVFSSYGGKVTVDGIITAQRYVTLLDTTDPEHPWVEIYRTEAQADATSTKAGYRQYSGGDPVSWVWVKGELPPAPPAPPAPTTPATGDAAGLAGASSAAAAAALGLATLARRRRRLA